MNQDLIPTSSVHTRRPVPLPRQLLAIVVATLAAIAVNVIFYFILRDYLRVPFLALEQYPPPQLSPIPVKDVIIFSTIFSIGASLVFLIVANTARRPTQVFVLICTIVLVMSLFLPLRIPTPPVPMSTKYSLLGMHILGAAVLVPLLIAIGFPSNKMR